MYPHTPTYVCFIFVVCIYDFNILSIFLWRKNENQKTEKGHSAVLLKKKRKKEKIDRKTRVFPHKYICGKQQKRQANSWYATTVHPIVSFMVVPGFFTTQSWLFFLFSVFLFLFFKNTRRKITETASSQKLEDKQTNVFIKCKQNQTMGINKGKYIRIYTYTHTYRCMYGYICFMNVLVWWKKVKLQR